MISVTLRVKLEFFRSFLKSMSICVHLRFISLSRFIACAIPAQAGTATNRATVAGHFCSTAVCPVFIFACMSAKKAAKSPTPPNPNQSPGLSPQIQVSMPLERFLEIAGIKP
jgi:hypothetical protein